jgi:hypothetical protein
MTTGGAVRNRPGRRRSRQGTRAVISGRSRTIPALAFTLRSTYSARSWQSEPASPVAHRTAVPRRQTALRAMTQRDAMLDLTELHRRNRKAAPDRRLRSTVVTYPAGSGRLLRTS